MQKVIANLPIPYDKDWAFGDLQVNIYSCGYHHMESPACTTAQVPKLILTDYVNKEKHGDFSRLNFNYVPDRNKIMDSFKRHYRAEIQGTEVLFVDVKKLGRDLEEADKDSETFKKRTRHCGWHSDNLRNACHSQNWKPIMQEIHDRVWEHREAMKYKPSKLSIVLFCAKGRHRSESVRCGLEGGFTLAGADIMESRALTEPVWRTHGCERCSECRCPSVTLLREIWIECFKYLRPKRTEKSSESPEDKKKLKGERDDSTSADKKKKTESVATSEQPQKKKQKVVVSADDEEKDDDEDLKSEADFDPDDPDDRVTVPDEDEDKEEEAEEDEGNKESRARDRDRGSKESRDPSEPLPLDVVHKVLQRLPGVFRPTANHLQVAHVEYPNPDAAVLGVAESEDVDPQIVDGMICAALKEHGIEQGRGKVQKT